METLIQTARQVISRLKENDERMNKMLDRVIELQVKANDSYNKLEKFNDIDLMIKNSLSRNLHKDPNDNQSENQGKPAENVEETYDNIDSKQSSEKLTQMNRRLKKENEKLLYENQELATSLAEHDHILQLVMKKYREQLSSLISLKSIYFNDEVKRTKEENEILKSEIAQKNDTIVEMRNVMKDAIQIDIINARTDQETIAKLQSENKILRELLQMQKHISSGGLDDELEDMIKKMEKAN